MRPLAASRRPRALRLLLATALLLGLALPAAVAAEGPPFPDPVDGQAVYDEAEALRPETEARAEEIIDAIEARTGAEIAVYTQLVPYYVTYEQAEAHAIALMDQWGVGRAGLDDGLVILFDLHDWDPCHGQVQLYGGPGYRATYLSNSDRQAIFDNDMLPLLERCDIDGALLVALEKVDANATPQYAATLAFFRGLNAVLGLFVAPALLVGLTGWGLFSWLRFGRDPIYLDDPSIHIPAAPRGLTPAAGALVRDGTTSRRALTAAMMDLASRNQLGFEPEKSGILGLGGTKITVQMEVPDPEDPVDLARLERIRRRPMDPATTFLHGKLESIGGATGEITPTEMLKLGSSVGTFDRRLEEHVVKQGWFRERPAEARNRWISRGLFSLFGGIGLVFIGANLPSDGLLLVGAAAIVAGVVLMILARAMPARTMPGAMIRAMLEAYRRTLEKTMAQARSMDQVVAEAALPILEEPDDAVAWGVALGLQEEVEQVLQRTADDLEEGRVTGVYVPRWYGGWSSSSAGREGGGGWAPGLMSSSPIPNFGGMMAALSTIGNSPSSSGSGGGGGGGFSGGSSGGGGGGAGGGF